jgi:hypothetical protein
MIESSPHLSCATCRTDLAGLDLTADCPICGAPLANTIYIRVIDPTSRTVTTDICCATCDYNLRTQPLDSVCPECGAPVADSLRRDILDFADRSWLGTIARGINWLAAALIAFPICWIVATIVLSSIPYYARYSDLLWSVTQIAVFSALAACGAFGMFLIVSRDTTSGAEFPSPSPRYIALAFPLLALPLFTIMVIAEELIGLNWSSALETLLKVFFAISLPASIAALTLVLRQIALRARKQRLARSAKGLARAFVVVAALIAVMTLVAFLEDYGPLVPIIDDLFMALETVAVVTGLLSFACYVTMLVLLWRFRRLLSETRVRADAFAQL